MRRVTHKERVIKNTVTVTSFVAILLAALIFIVYMIEGDGKDEESN